MTAIPGESAGRTPAVRKAIIERIAGVTDCADVTDAHLAGIAGTLDLASRNITSLRAGDFAGLSWVRLLDLYDNALTTLPSGLLSGLTNLAVVYLDENALTALPADLLAPVPQIDELWVAYNALTALPDGLFAGVSGFQMLELHDNPGDPSLAHLYFCWPYCKGGAPMPIEFSLQPLGQGRFKLVVPIGTPFTTLVTLEVTHGSLADDTITIPPGRVESDVFTVTRTAGTSAAVTVDIVDIRHPDPRSIAARDRLAEAHCGHRACEGCRPARGSAALAQAACPHRAARQRRFGGGGHRGGLHADARSASRRRAHGKRGRRPDGRGDQERGWIRNADERGVPGQRGDRAAHGGDAGRHGGREERRDHGDGDRDGVRRVRGRRPRRGGGDRQGRRYDHGHGLGRVDRLRSGRRRHLRHRRDHRGDGGLLGGTLGAAGGRRRAAAGSRRGGGNAHGGVQERLGDDEPGVRLYRGGGATKTQTASLSQPTL